MMRIHSNVYNKTVLHILNKSEFSLPILAQVTESELFNLALHKMKSLLRGRHLQFIIANIDITLLLLLLLLFSSLFIFLYHTNIISFFFFLSLLYTQF